MTKAERWAMLRAAVQARSLAAVELIPLNVRGKIERAVHAITRKGDWTRAERYLAAHYFNPGLIAGDNHTIRTYWKGCRCDTCRAAWAAHKKRKRAELAQKVKQNEQ